MKTFYQQEERSANYPELTKGLSVVTSRRSYPILSFDDLTKGEQKDNEWDTCREHSYIRYRCNVIPLETFTRCYLPDWDGFAADSFFSGTVIKFTEDGDCLLGFAYSDSMDPEAPKKGFRVVFSA